MTNRLNRKIALVTAAGQGIGRAISEAFIAEGATVIAHPLREWPDRHRACIAAPPVMGPRKRSSAISGSAPSPVKRSISATGSRS